MARNKFDVDERLESPFRWKHLKRAGKYIVRHKYKMLAALRARKDLRDRHDVADFLRSVATGVIDRHPNDAAFPERMRDQAREMLKDVVR